MDVFSIYKAMPEVHRNNLKSYYILEGIYDCFPDIAEDDAKFIHDISVKVENENINPYSISHYLTDHYTRGNITKEDLEKASSSEICEAVYFNNLDYMNLEKWLNEEEKEI